MTSLTHYKTLYNPDYIGAYALDVDGKYVDKVVKIIKVDRKMVDGPDGKQECVVATLEKEKPMILNATNLKTLAKLFSSPHIEHWFGKQVTLYVAKIKAFGDQVDALRIRDVLPTEALVDPADALKKISACTTLDELRKVYTGLPQPEQNHPEVVALKDKMKGQLK